MEFFGMGREEIESLGMTVGLGFLMLYMLFIIVQLAVESKAGKYGLFVMLLALGTGMLGFVSKAVIARSMGM